MSGLNFRCLIDNYLCDITPFEDYVEKGAMDVGLLLIAFNEYEIEAIRNLFKEKVAEFINSDLLRNVTVSDWDTIFKAIMATEFETKPIIVIDEFQYIGKSNSAFPSIMQRIWDTILKDKSVMLILCGSLITMMKEQTLR